MTERESMTLAFIDLDGGRHDLGEASVSTSIGPRGHGAMNVRLERLDDAARIALDLASGLAMQWEIDRDDGRFVGQFQDAGGVTTVLDGEFAEFEIDLVALAPVRPVDAQRPDEADEALAAMTPEEVARIEKLGNLARHKVGEAVLELVAGRDQAIPFSDAISAAIAGGVMALVSSAVRALPSEIVNAAAIRETFVSILDEVVAPIVLEEFERAAATVEGFGND